MTEYLNDPHLENPYLEQEALSMTDYSKIIFVNTDGDYEETSAADSLKFASFKTANHELTDSLLGDVVNKMIKSDGSRAFAADQPMGGFKLTGLAAGSANGDAIRYEQLVAVQNQIANLEFQDSVIDRVTAPVGGESAGDRYLVIATATDDFENHEDEIAVFNGVDFDFILPTTGMLLSVDDENDVLYYYNGSAWVPKYFEATTASLGVEKVGMDIRLDLLSGGGLALTGNEVGINFAADFTIDAADDLAPKASDYASTSSGEGASRIGIEDAGGYTTAEDVEEALQELYGLTGAKQYTVGAGGVTKGDLLYLSANNTVTKMPINAMHRAIGVALTTQLATETVLAQSADYPLVGALTGATAGTRYYWDGSVLTTTIPSSSGSYVWQAGVAINATDLLAMVEFVKKNS